MNIGSLYKVKEWSWLLFPTKEKAASAADARCRARHAPSVGGTDALHAAVEVAWYSRRFNCEVTYFSPDSYIVFLEEDGKLKKVLTADGKIGWIWFTENYNDYFEEMKTEE